MAPSPPTTKRFVLFTAYILRRWTPTVESAFYMQSRYSLTVSVVIFITTLKLYNRSVAIKQGAEQYVEKKT